MKVRELNIGIERDPVIKRALQIFRQVQSDTGAQFGDNPYSDARLLVQEIAKGYRNTFNRAADPVLVAAVLLDFCRQGYSATAEKTAFVDRVARDEKLDVGVAALLAKFHKAGNLATAQDYLRRAPSPK